MIPAIIIEVDIGTLESDFAQTLLGIEEEGIPFRCHYQLINNLAQSAHRAAKRSPLLVGVAVNQTEIVVHYKNLPEDEPLFILSGEKRHHKMAQRELGSNVARLVKGVAFK